MKKKFFAFLALVLFALLIIMPCYAVQEIGIKSFSDVLEEHWAYQTIIDMTKSGLFKGTSEPIDGVGTFSPDNKMTRAEFVTVSLRAIDPENASKITQDPEQWWRGYYTFAVDNGLLKENEFDSGNMDAPISREEMAMVMVRCVEKAGEKLTQRVGTTQIADYDRVGEYYKDFVRDCYSYGLLCGVDLKGTFAPDNTLTRAEAATVLCRLIDKDKRVAVEFVKEDAASDKGETGGFSGSSFTKPEDNNDKEENSGNAGGNIDNDNDNNNDNDNTTTVPDETPKEDNSEQMPWDNGGKQPSEYTWEEFNALGDIEQEAFFEWFDSPEAFETWMSNIKNEQKQEQESGTSGAYPWENGGKQPSEYTWEEFNVLGETEQEAFFEWFETPEAFETWMNSVKDVNNEESGDTGEYPWDKGGKQPSEYTWEEFNALGEIEQEAFFEWFDSPEAFETWMSNVKNEQKQEQEPGTSGAYPWENGGKQPSEYTWEEFNALGEIEQEAFFEWFETPEAFELWMNSVIQ